MCLIVVLLWKPPQVLIPDALSHSASEPLPTPRCICKETNYTRCVGRIVLKPSHLPLHFQMFSTCVWVVQYGCVYVFRWATVNWIIKPSHHWNEVKRRAKVKAVGVAGSKQLRKSRADKRGGERWSDGNVADKRRKTNPFLELLLPVKQLCV